MRRRTTARFWLFLIVLTLIVSGVSFAALSHRCMLAGQQLSEVKARRNDLVLQVQDLEKSLEYAKTDDYIIRAARDELGYIMPGEVRYVNGK